MEARGKAGLALSPLSKCRPRPLPHQCIRTCAHLPVCLYACVRLYVRACMCVLSACTHWRVYICVQTAHPRMKGYPHKPCALVCTCVCMCAGWYDAHEPEAEILSPTSALRAAGGHDEVGQPGASSTQAPLPPASCTESDWPATVHLNRTPGCACAQPFACVFISSLHRTP